MSFVRAICGAMQRIAPLRLAESWDNVGLLLEAPTPAPGKKVFLTIDLTPSVASEALSHSANIIIAYHPPLFRPISKLTLDNPLQASLLRLLQAGISVYSPHTALDSVNDGINDWIARAFEAPIVETVQGADINKKEEKEEEEEETEEGCGGGLVHKPTFHIIEEYTSRFIEDKGDEQGGAGRIVTLPGVGHSIEDIVRHIKLHLGVPGQAHLATPYGVSRNIKTVAICAGAGASMFKNVEADLLVTGEMPHHDVLAAIAANRYVLLCGHTNTERGYLPVLRSKLLEETKTDPSLEGLEVEISKEDTHPLVGC